MVSREACFGIRFSAELPGWGRKGSAQYCIGQHLQARRDLECIAVHTVGAARAARVNLLLVVMLGTLETSKTLFYATLGMFLASALSTLLASQFLCAHLPVLKFGGKKAHRPYSLCLKKEHKEYEKAAISRAQRSKFANKTMWEKCVSTGFKCVISV